MMRWWKVRTRADLTIESNWFGYKKRYYCYFTYGSKFVYAETREDARMKYGDLFFSPIEDGYDRKSLKYAEYFSECISSNMDFNLPINYRVAHTNESIYVCEKEVNENILVIRNKSTANDFRDWFMNNDNTNYNTDEFDSIFK